MKQNKSIQYFLSFIQSFSYLLFFLVALIIFLPVKGFGKTAAVEFNAVGEKIDIGLAAIFTVGMVYGFLKIRLFFKRKRAEELLNE